MAAIVCDNISQRFIQRWVLVRLSMQIDVGQRVLLTGENGAGKTTLLRICATALRPTRGQITLLGQPVWPAHRQIRTRLALMTHQHYFYENLSAQENLALVARLKGRSQKTVTQLLQRVGLAAAAHRMVVTFSAGMKRRLALARMLLVAPELVFLDEPLAQLDPNGQRLVEDVVAELAQQGCTMVISTHDIARVKPWCTHHLHLHGGTRPCALVRLTDSAVRSQELVDVP